MLENPLSFPLFFHFFFLLRQLVEGAMLFCLFQCPPEVAVYFVGGERRHDADSCVVSFMEPVAAQGDPFEKGKQHWAMASQIKLAKIHLHY